MLTSSFARTAALFFAVLAVFAFSVEGASPSSEKSAKATKPRVHKVKMVGMNFVPERLEVSVGDTIEWINADFVPHTATAIVNDAKLFDSGVLPAKAKWKYVATKPGTVPYVCLLHPMMKGMLFVKE